MFCYNCGRQVEPGARYCANCGAVQNNAQPIQPVVTKVNQDDTLPKNSNFLITLLVLFIVVICGVIFLTTYKEKYDYKQFIDYKGYRVYYPLGFKAQIGEDDQENVDEAKKQLYIYTDDVKYSFNYDNDADYSYYKKNEFKEIDKFLSSLGYTVQEIKEHEVDGHNIAIAKFKSNEDIMFFYLYNTGRADTTYFGYIATKDDDLAEKDMKELVKMLSKVEYKESK